MLLEDLKPVNKIETIKGKPNINNMGEKIGEGAFADVFKTDKINTVIKIAYINRKPHEDGYYKFLQEAIKNQDNPFFPRIYNAKLYEYNDVIRGEDKTLYMLVVEMEKLIPITNEKVEDTIEPLLYQLGFDEMVHREKYHFKHLTNMLKGATFSPQTRNELKKRTNNPKFKEALDALEYLFQNQAIDTHAGNWMLRLTGHGPQLVITDPFV